MTVSMDFIRGRGIIIFITIIIIIITEMAKTFMRLIKNSGEKYLFHFWPEEGTKERKNVEVEQMITCVWPLCMYLLCIIYCAWLREEA